jgi:hypothetical protein
LYHAYLYRRVAAPSPLGPGDTAQLQVAFKRVLQAGLATFSPEDYDEESVSADRASSPDQDIIQLDQDDPRAIDFRNQIRTYVYPLSSIFLFPDATHYLNSWFRRVPWSSIRLHEIRQWIYWSIYNVDLPPLDKVPSSHRIVMDDAINLLQKRLGALVPEGYTDGKVKPLRLTIDPVYVMWRPLIFYALIGTINRCLRLYLYRQWQMTHNSYDGLE